MRADMNKVLTERPRRGHARCYHDVRQRSERGELEDLPTKQGIRRPHILFDERKEFSDLIGPLRRFLWSSCGRRWDDVWSEICAQLSNNTTGSHLKGHALQEVVTNTHLVDGKVYEITGRCREVTDGLYVHPSTGLICATPPRTGRRAVPVTVDGILYTKATDGVLFPWRRPDPPAALVFKKGRFMPWQPPRNPRPVYARKILGPEREAVRVDGLWHWVVFASVPAPTRMPTPAGWRVVNHERTDIVTGKVVRAGRYRGGKRQMSARDLRRTGLVNG